MEKRKDSHSLEEVHESVAIVQNTSVWKKILAFFGPAYMISVGYMDPGNWATDIAGGSQFGYKLLWVLLMSNIMALLLQSLSARLGIVSRRDLAQASRETYPKGVNYILYGLAEIAIAACDLAEVLGMAIGLQLLFDLPLLWGVSITMFDTFLLLFLLNKGIKKMEAFIIALIGIIGFSFLAEMFFARPELGQVVHGLVPSIPNSAALYIAIGIIGATVMPHNLYLHSSLVQTRKFDRTFKGIKQALRYNFVDSLIALNLAFFVNAAILILAAATFFNQGLHEVADIQDAHRLLEPLLGTSWASTLFALALIAAGQSSTITGTLAGQIVMEGYLNLRIQPWVRRIVTRLLAIVPAFIAIVYLGEEATGELLLLSQVILSLQLGFAIIPLIHFVSDKEKMKEFAIGKFTKAASWIIALVIVTLNAKLVFDEIKAWITASEEPVYIWVFVVPLAVGAVVLLLYIILKPFILKRNSETRLVPHIDEIIVREQDIKVYKNIAVALDFSKTDRRTISSALQLGGKDAKYTLIHIVETVGAMIHGDQAHDYETYSDKDYLEKYKQRLEEKGYIVATRLSFGSPKSQIPAVVNEENAKFDMLILGAHGHNWLKDIIFGTTVDAVRHRVKIPVMIIKKED